MTAPTVSRRDISLEEQVEYERGFALEQHAQRWWEAGVSGNLSTGERVNLSRTGNTSAEALANLEAAIAENGWTVDPPAPAPEPADDRPFADEWDLERHMQKQDCSWGDAWNYFRDQGYNVDGLEYAR